MKNGLDLSVQYLNSIKRVIVIPTYHESETLPALVAELAKSLSVSDAVLVLDDSPLDVFEDTKLNTQIQVGNSNCHLLFESSKFKGGRGAAVRRGMLFAEERFPNLEFLVECDADGSHQAHDIIRVLNAAQNYDLVIGSRYLSESKILGWSKPRKILSRLLNTFIPQLFRLPVKDITNGLRRYSKVAVKLIISKTPINLGFTYLTEQAYIVSQNRLLIVEIPIEFAERVAGVSSVTWKEILNSLKGVLTLRLKTMRSEINE